MSDVAGIASSAVTLHLQHCQHHLDVLQRFNYFVAHNLQRDILNMPSLDQPEQYDAWVREFVGHVQTICEQLTQLSQDREAIMASIARAQPLDVAIVAQDAVAHYRNVHPALAITESYAADQLLIHGDAYLLHTCITEVLNNAADAIAAAGRPGAINVSVCHTAGMARLTVHDNGCGMDLSDSGMTQRIFMPFYSTKKAGHNTHLHAGLGLHIVNEIVTAHRGAVSVTSHAGESSTFAIALPLACLPPCAPHGAGSSGSPSRCA